MYTLRDFSSLTLCLIFQVKELRRLYGNNTVFVDAGDQYQGTIWFYKYEGNVTVHFMNELGYDVMVSVCSVLFFSQCFTAFYFCISFSQLKEKIMLIHYGYKIFYQCWYIAALNILITLIYCSKIVLLIHCSNEHFT